MGARPTGSAAPSDATKAGSERGGIEKDLRFVEADADLEARIDDAYREKYRRYAKGIVDSTLTPQARSAGLKLVPQDERPTPNTGDPQADAIGSERGEARRQASPKLASGIYIDW